MLEFYENVILDYAHDDLFWQGHFYQELSNIKREPFLGEKGLAQLNDLQDLVWHNFLSPYTYEEELQELGKKKLFSRVKRIRNEFQKNLKENPKVVLQHLRKDLITSLNEIQNNKEGTDEVLRCDFEKKLCYYNKITNVYDYAETLASLLLGIKKNKEELALSETQYGWLTQSLIDVLHKINKNEYFQLEKERESRKSSQEINIEENEKTLNKIHTGVSLEEGENYSSYFFYSYDVVKGIGSLLKKGLNFTIENPMQAITTGLIL